MKKVKTVLLVLGVNIAAVYLLGSFLLFSFNVSTWGIVGVRFIVMMFVLLVVSNIYERGHN